jgi:hypothetical protein
MRRAVATAALAAVAVVALPMPNAFACTVPMPMLNVSAERVPAGGTLAVSGDVVADEDGRVPSCQPLPPPTPTPTPAAEPSGTMTATAEPMPSETPLVTLPPILPAAYEVPEPVTVTLRAYAEWPALAAPARTIGVIPPNPTRPWRDDLYTYSFAGRVTVPGDVKPGVYVLDADEANGVWFGFAHITVVDELASTGTAVLPMLQLGVLALLAGGGALLAARKV